MAIFSAIATAISGLAGAIGSGVAGIGSGLGALGGASGLAGVAGLVGTGVQIMGQMKAQKGAERAEALRLRQQNLEAARARRSTYRQMVIARSQALSTATAQGASDSTGAAGGMATVQGQGASNIQGINQGQSIGYDMFQANKMISSGQTLSSIGSGISALGSFFGNYEQNRRVFSAV